MQEEIKTIINNEEYFLIKAFKDHSKYRQSFNNLTKKTYGFDFEEWYIHGYWTDKYIPYSLLHNQKVVANVSVSTIDFLIDGEQLHTIQIGTVMTEEAYRNKGLSRELINIILEEYEDKCDLFYLYANDSVLEFYPKFGFAQAQEFSYSRQVEYMENKLANRKLSMDDAKDREIILRLVSDTLPVSRISMVGNTGLDMFYLTLFMSNDIYYIEALDLATVVDFEEDNMLLMDVFCDKEFDLADVINSLMNKDTKKVTLGFTPLEDADYTAEILKEEGTTFFVRGRKPFHRGRFPILSHA